MIAAMVLSAGRGSRFGYATKQLARRQGMPLVAHAVAAARAAPVARVIVVVGRRGAQVAAAARRAAPGVVIVCARQWHDGLPASLAAGARALWPIERRAIVFLADMPEVPHGLARRLIGRGSARAYHGERPGHPVLLDAAALEAARAGRGGPKGARKVAADRRCRFDIDRRRRLHLAIPALMRAPKRSYPSPD